MKTSNNSLGLIPNKFKKVAYGLILLDIFLGILFISKVLPIEKAVGLELTKAIFLFSLLLLSLCKDKVEDERTFRIRAKALSAAFIYGVVFAILNPFMNLIFHNSFFSDKDVFEMFILMFIFYFVMKYMIGAKE